MDYSVATAPISWGTALWLAIPALVGLMLARRAWRGEPAVNGSTTAFSRAARIGLGGLMVLIGVGFAGEEVGQTTNCRQALEAGQTDKVSGQVFVTDRDERKAWAHRLRFNVAGHVFETKTDGLSCDCGFITPVGRSVPIADGQRVEIESIGRVVLRMTSVD